MNQNHFRKWWQRYQTDAAMIGLIVVFFVLFFSWIWSSGKFLVGGDAFLYSYPLRTVAWQTIKQGGLPLWTPLVLSGYPQLAMSQIALAYPLTWGYLGLPGYVAEEIYVLAPFLLAPAFTYAYARQIGCSRIASLLAGLSFGFGGAAINLLGVIGMPTNAQMWLPLILFAIERARTSRLATCVAGATGAYAMSVLTGYAQSFVVVGLVAITYAIFLGCLKSDPTTASTDGPTQSKAKDVARQLSRWRPLFVTLASILAAGCLAAFQIFETLRAVRRSVRSSLSYESFGEGSFTLAGAGRALIAPMYTERFADVTTYVPPLVLLLAITAIVLRRKFEKRDARIWFWAGIAICSWLLILGTNTPIYNLIYRVPLLNQFRVPSRHTFEWTFALSLLSAFGWDALMTRRPFDWIPAVMRTRENFLAACLLVAAGATAWLWWRATGAPPVSDAAYDPHRTWYLGALTFRAYLLWKILFTVLTLSALGLLVNGASRGRRTVVLATLVVVCCFAEPYLTARQWWTRYLKEPARFTQPAVTTRWLLEHDQANSGRVYTRVQTAVAFAEEQSASPLIDGPDVSAIYGLQNVAGYEPLILDRYSRALGNVFLDSVTPRRGFVSDLSLFTPRSQVLDLLNTHYVTSYSNLDVNPPAPLIRSGIEFAATDLGDEIKPGATVVIDCPPTRADTLALVTSLSNSVGVSDNSRVASVKISTTDKRIIEGELLAGRDTAEWAHERADVAPTINHRLAPIFDRVPGDAGNSFPAYRYLATLPLGASVDVARVEITNLTSGQPLALWKVSLYDSSQRRSHPVTHFDWSRWQRVYDEDGALILRNARALPRAWLVAEAEAVDGEEALRRIDGESPKPFDPRRTALVEVAPAELPKLPGGELSPDSTAQIFTYEPSRIEVDTTSPTPAVLILSEIFYPGWEAMVDGQPAKILLTDYLLRGVALPAGRHRVQMRYRAPAARNGAIISALTLTLMAALFVFTKLGRRRLLSGTR